MEVKANISFVRMSAQKMRLLTVGLRNKSPKEALLKLQFHPQKGKIFLEKLIKQGVANAISNFKLAEDNLYIKQIEVNDGPGLKRMDKSHGARFDRGLIKKRSSKLLLILDERESKNTEVIKKEPVKEKKSPPSLKLRRVNGTKN